jgi:uncharacterized membrane protein YjjP (DUF1212 family)
MTDVQSISLVEALFWAVCTAILLIAYPYSKAILHGRPRQIKKKFAFAVAVLLHAVVAGFITALLFRTGQISGVWSAAAAGGAAERILYGLGSKEKKGDS